MSIVGTRWKLHALSSRPDYNGRSVVVVENLDAGSDRLCVKFETSETKLRVKPNNLVSHADDNVNASVLALAYTALKRQTSMQKDAKMDEFLCRYDKGDFDGALSAAATWTLTQSETRAHAASPH